MANKGTNMNIIIRCAIAEDQLTATVDAVTVEGNYSNPDAADPSDKVSRPIRPAKEAWDGTMTGDAMIAACLASFKSQIGA